MYIWCRRLKHLTFITCLYSLYWNASLCSSASNTIYCQMYMSIIHSSHSFVDSGYPPIQNYPRHRCHQHRSIQGQMTTGLSLFPIRQMLRGWDSTIHQLLPEDWWTHPNWHPLLGLFGPS